MDTSLANRCRCFRGLKGRARVPRAALGVPPSAQSVNVRRETRRTADETSALPEESSLTSKSPSLRAFFEGGRSTLQIREGFAGEM
jgi:hypothetical protein